MIGSDAFNYVNVLDKAADASWTRNEVISNNLANVDTPNYKRKDVQFESYLMTALENGDSLDESIGEVDLSTLSSTTYTDSANLSTRLDGNNVDIDTESSSLAQNQIKYYSLLDCMTQEFSRIKTVLSSR